MSLDDVPVVWAQRSAATVRAEDEWLLRVVEELQGRVLEERAAGPVLHDVNNVMTALLYEVHAATERARGGEDCLEALERVKAALATAASITREFAQIGRSRRGARAEVDVGKRLGALRSVLDSMAGEQVTVELRVERGLPRAAMRPDTFDRIILNLVGNAADAVGSRGTIGIRARRASPGSSQLDSGWEPREAEYLLVTVEDDGCGMAEGVAARAFNSTYTTKEEGKGIGLALVARCIHRLGGAVGVRSAPGIGAAIDVYLPVVATVS